jgi:hypothetical protein
MTDEQAFGPTQKTQPQGKNERGKSHAPIAIPVPERDEIERLLTEAAKGAPPGST